MEISKNYISPPLTDSAEILEHEKTCLILLARLEEKIGENDALVAQQNKQKKMINEVKSKIKNLTEYNDKQITTSARNSEENKILEGRSETLDESLKIMVIENIEIRYDIKSTKASKASKLAIKLVKKNCSEEEIALKAECVRLREREASYKNAEEEYEAKIRRLIKINNSGIEAAVEKLNERTEELEKLVGSEKAEERESIKAEVEELKKHVGELWKLVKI